MLHILPWFSFAILFYLFFIHFDVQTLKNFNAVISESVCVCVFPLFFYLVQFFINRVEKYSLIFS